MNNMLTVAGWRTLFCLSIALPLWGIGGPVARAYCGGSAHSSATTWAVRIHADLPGQMRHADGTTWTRAEVERSVQWILSRINDSAHGDTPWMYLDTAATPSTCTWLDSDCCAGASEQLVANCGIANVIHLVPTHCGALYALGGAGSTWVIQVQSTFSEPNLADVGDPPMCAAADARYDHWATGTSWGFENIILHEFGHVLGLSHPNECPGTGWATICPAGANGCSVMLSEDAPAVEMFTADDSNALESFYGNRDTPTARQWERILPATSFGAISTGTYSSASFYSVSSSPMSWADGTEMTVASYDRSTDVPVSFSWNWSSLTTTSLGQPNLFSTWGPIGTSQSSATRFVTTQSSRLTADARRWRRRLTVSSRPLVAGTWSTVRTDPGPGTNADTAAPGVSTARDPVTGFLIHAFRADDGHVLLQGSNGTLSFSNVIYTSFISMNTPQVACSGAGTRNCILTIVDPGRPFTTATSQRLQWMDFSWSQSGTTASWDPGSLFTTSWNVQGQHTVAVARQTTNAYQYDITFALQSVDGSPFTSVFMLQRLPPSSTFTLVGVLYTENNTQPHVALGSIGTSFEAMTFTRIRTP